MKNHQKITRSVNQVLLIAGLLACLQSSGKAQQKQALRPRDNAPDFQLNQLSNYPSKKAALKDFKGKWLVLDFWTRTCLACIQSFDKLNAYSKKFSESASFLLIGNNSRKYNKGIEELYKRIEKSKGLSLITAFDSLLFETYQVSSTPHVVLIDPGGKIKAITYSDELSEEKLRALFQNKAVSFLEKLGTTVVQKEHTERADSPVTLINTENEAIPHQSKISKWTSCDPVLLNLNFNRSSQTGRYLVQAISLKRLYLMAYVGQAEWNTTDSLYQHTWQAPILLLEDSSDFQDDFLHEKGLYNYQLSLKGKPDKTALMLAMQSDLKKVFGYQVNFENEKAIMPYLKLSLKAKARHLAHSKTPKKIKGDPSGYTFEGIKPADLLAFIHKYQPGQPILDGTGISFPFDLQLSADMTDLKSIRKALNSKGFELLTAYKIFKVLTISARSKGKQSEITQHSE